jgi:outer membrane protein assembly factor BamB
MPLRFAIPCPVPILVFAASIVAAEPEWPQFRGPGGQGHATASSLPTSWSESENVAWKAPLPGRGWSSPVIAGNEIWLTTAIESPVSEQEKAERVKGTTNTQPLTVSGRLSMRAVCVDRRTGRIVHDVELLTEERPQPTHTMNGFASPTPVIEEGKLYCHFGTHGTACLDTTMLKVLWANRELVLNHENGPGGSPVLWGQHLIFHCDGSDVQYIVALDKRTGRVAWKTNRSGQMNPEPQLKKAYATPLLLEVNGQPQVLSPASDWLYSYDPRTGTELWRLSYGLLGFSIVPRPVVGHGMLFMSTSFTQPQILAVTLDDQSPKIVWRHARQAPNICSPLLVADELYLLSDKGIATCLDALTGKPLWTERLSGNYAASPILADGKIYVCSREGETTILAPGPVFRELGKGRLDGAILASPAAVESALYIRSDRALYRIEHARR